MRGDLRPGLGVGVGLFMLIDRWESRLTSLSSSGKKGQRVSGVTNQ